MAVAPGEGTNNVSSADIALQPPAHRITNFPLPRELRDEIYAYLLDAERVEEVVENSEVTKLFDMEDDKQSFNPDLFGGSLRTYKFTVGIMTVNKTIGGEAQLRFQSQNRFVRIGYDVVGFQALQALMDLPVVANLPHEKLITQHCLSVNIDCPDAARALRKVVKGLAPTENTKGCVVICFQSFRRLCEILRFFATMDLPPVPCMTSARSERLHTIHRSSLGALPGLLHIKISANGRLKRPFKPANLDHEFISSCLQLVRGGGYDLHITDIGAGMRVDEVKAEMTAPIVFPVPFLIDRMQVLRNAKSLVDMRAACGELTEALNGYSFLQVLNKLLWQHIFSDLDDMSSGLKKAMEELFLSSHLTLDILCSHLAVAIQLGVLGAAQEAKEAMSRYQGAMTPRMRSTQDHLCVIAAPLSVPLGDPLHRTRVLMCTQLVERLERLQVKDKWIEHDLGKLRAYVAAIQKKCIEKAPCGLAGAMKLVVLDDHDAADSQSDGQSIKHNAATSDGTQVPLNIRDIIPQLSIWSMPFRVYDSMDDPDVRPLSRWEDYVGWEDRAHVAEFAEQDRASVHDMQKKMGLPLSKFEWDP